MAGSLPAIQAFSWSGSAPSTTVYPAVEVSVLQAFAAGSPAAPGQNVTVAVYGVTNPSNCSDLGAFSLRVGQWRGDTAPSDRILCPDQGRPDWLFLDLIILPVFWGVQVPDYDGKLL